jgi:hypothetical protein
MTPKLSVPARRALLVTLAGAAAGVAQARQAAPAEIRNELPGARLQGTARMRFFGLPVYDIRLWSAQPPLRDDPASQALALELQYARALDGAAIAERSLQEMRRQDSTLDAARAEQWLTAMRRLFPDVTAGDRLTGVQRPARAARFFHNGRFIGEVADGDFARLFFGIWLSERTSEPGLRAELLKGLS